MPDSDYQDYFSDEDFRRVMGDNTSPYDYDPDDVLRAQAEVVDRLEKWARTSWKLRTVTAEIHRRNVPLVTTLRVPIVAIESVTVNGDVVTLSDIQYTSESGIVRWGDWTPGPFPYLTAGSSRLEVTYTYGFDEDTVPMAVMRPCIVATASNLDGEEGRSKIPRNTTRYSAERTDITLGRRGSVEPWPWDPRATDDIRGYWLSRRPRSIMQVA